MIDKLTCPNCKEFMVYGDYGYGASFTACPYCGYGLEWDFNNDFLIEKDCKIEDV